MQRVLVACLAIACAAPASAQDSPGPAPWPLELTDPAAQTDASAAADLMLPLPCGGSMAFQRVVVPVDISDPLDDRQFRMGQSEAQTGFSDYLRPTHLRGAFADSETGVSYYFIGRYEMSVGQFRALTGDCEAGFGPRDRFAKGDLSWFDAVDLMRQMTEWLLSNAPETLPSQGDRSAFLRLPTETEWEYAARGGSRIDPTLFPGRRFFAEGDLGDYAHYQAAGQGRGKLRPIGLRNANPLGLFDIYGNAEELVLEPYRLNAVGRAHGQAGGIVTRGGSIDATEEQIYTAQRREYPAFSSRTGRALKGEFFGLRPVISAHIVSDANFDGIRQGWIADADSGNETDADPLAELARLLDEELDPRRKQALSELQLALRIARDDADSSLQQAAKSTLLSGAAFVDRLRATTTEIDLAQREARDLLDRASVSVGEQREQLKSLLRSTLARMEDLSGERDDSLLYYRGTLETLSEDVPGRLLESAYLALGQEFGEAEQERLLDLLNSFWADVAEYQENPDMEQSALLGLALQ